MYPHTLVSAFVIQSLESITDKLSIVEQTGLSLIWSETPKTGYLIQINDMTKGEVRAS